MSKEKKKTLEQQVADVAIKVLLTGNYVAKYSVGDKLVSIKVKTLSKKTQVFLVLEIYHPVRGLPTYRVISSKHNIRSSEYCHKVDLIMREVGELEEAVFL